MLNIASHQNHVGGFLNYVCSSQNCRETDFVSLKRGGGGKRLSHQIQASLFTLPVIISRLLSSHSVQFRKLQRAGAYKCDWMTSSTHPESPFFFFLLTAHPMLCYNLDRHLGYSFNMLHLSQLLCFWWTCLILTYSFPPTLQSERVTWISPSTTTTKK